MALHEVQLKGYSVRPGNLSLGTFDSYGIEQLHVTLDDTWSGLAVTATFNPPKGEPVEIRVPENGLIDVPAEATANEGTGAIVYCGVANGVQLITKTQGYNVITHGNVGGTAPFNPSESLATQVLQAALNAEKNIAEANTAAQSAQTAAESAAVAAKASAESASKAAAEAAAAKPYAESAKASAEAARNSENQAQQSSAEANTAKNAAQNAQAGAESSATAAAKSAKEAAASAVNLDSAANTATQKAAAASASATAAKASESAAVSSEAAARKYANSAESAAKTAGEAAAAAAEAKTAAESAQADAAASKTDAANSATQANQSANAAAKSAVAAKTSEDAAEKSAADADSTANSIKESMTQIAALQKRQNVLVGSETGNPIDVDDAFAAPLCGLTVYGRSTQDGTPTPDAPVPIVSAGDGGSVAVKVTGKNLFYEQEFQEYFINSVANTVGLAVGNVSCVLQVVTGAKYYVTRNKIGTKFRVAVVDKLPTLGNPVTPSSGINADSKRQIEISATSKYMVIQCEDEAAFSELMVSLDSSTAYSPYREQLLTLPTPNGLPGIPVTSGGNYTDQNGQQWICDEVDLERGVKVQRVKVLDLLDSGGFDNDRTWHINTKTNFGAGTSYIPVEWFTPVTKCLCNTFPVQMNKYQTGTSADLSIYYSRTGDVISLKSALFNPKGQHATVYEAKAWFTAHPTYLYVPIEPIETPLAPAEIAAYKALTAYAPDTVVQASDGAGIKLNYQRDVNLVVKNLEDAIASMTTT